MSRRVDPSDVSIVVPVGGPAAAWGRCARSLARLNPPPGEIVVVLDGRNEDLAATAIGIGAELVELERRGGPARARNRGAQAARGEILLFLDSDVDAPPDLVAAVAGLLAEEDRPAAVIGSYDDAPGDPGFLSQYRNLMHHHVHQAARPEASTFWAGCGAVSRQVFLDVGGFDESYVRPSVEDIELGARLIAAGHEIRLVKDLQVKHLKRWRLGDMLRTDLWARAVPWTELMLAEGRMINDLNVKTRDRLSVVLAFLTLAALPAALWSPWSLAPAIAALVLVVLLNGRIFLFFGRRRGWLFALGTIPLYWIYLIVCGLGYGIGWLRHLTVRRA